MRGAAACTTISSLGRLHRGLLVLVHTYIHLHSVSASPLSNSSCTAAAVRREVQCGLALLLLKSQFEHGSSEYKGGHSMQ